jgi:hypothetical protein
LVNLATEENIISVIKLQCVPSSGKLYGDDVSRASSDLPAAGVRRHAD